MKIEKIRVPFFYVIQKLECFPTLRYRLDVIEHPVDTNPSELRRLIPADTFPRNLACHGNVLFRRLLDVRTLELAAAAEGAVPPWNRSTPSMDGR